LLYFGVGTLTLCSIERDSFHEHDFPTFSQISLEDLNTPFLSEDSSINSLKQLHHLVILLWN